MYVAPFARPVTSSFVLQALVNEIGELKKQLAVERETKLAREIEVRQEVCDYFSNLRSREQAECKWVMCFAVICVESFIVTMSPLPELLPSAHCNVSFTSCLFLWNPSYLQFKICGNAC